MRTSCCLLVVALLIALTACGGDDSSINVSPATDDAVQALRKAQAALDKAGGYTLRLEQHDLILPHWGGVDGGTVQVNRDGSSARAVLTRTGERDATYTITFAAGQTYFKRSTCNDTFRVPGGSADVLRPFLFIRTKALANATNARWEGDFILASVDGIGNVAIDLDLKTARPTRIRGMSANVELHWIFDAWGSGLDVSTPAKVQDRGPGGIPC